MLVPLAEATAEVAGAKAGTLGVLLRAGLPVPPGAVVPLAACRAATERLDVARLVRTAGPEAVRQAVTRAVLDPALAAELTRAVHDLGGGPVAVRSSATGEDSPERSAAGQHLTTLGVTGTSEVLDAVRACWASLWSPEAVAYRRLAAVTTPPETAVLVQRHVDADVAGVLFTGAPDAPVVVEASWGLGEPVVGGLVTPDRYVVDAAASAEAHVDAHVHAVVGTKATRLDRSGSRLVTTDVAAGSRAARCLDDAAVRRLARLGRHLATLLGCPQDVEWALVGGAVHVLQSRPVTAEVPHRRVGGLATPPDDTRATQVLMGVPGSRGVRRGTVRVVGGPDGFGAVQPGDVLVCRFTDPAWTRLFGVVAAVVTEVGGVLSHAAVVAREHGIPAVLAVPGVLAALRDGDRVEVDGTAGTVRLEA